MILLFIASFNTSPFVSCFFIFIKVALATSGIGNNPSKQKYKTQADFCKPYNYAKYVKKNITIGMKVCCLSKLLKLNAGEIGTVIGIDYDEDLSKETLEVSQLEFFCLHTCYVNNLIWLFFICR